MGLKLIAILFLVVGAIYGNVFVIFSSCITFAKSEIMIDARQKEAPPNVRDLMKREMGYTIWKRWNYLFFEM